MKNENILNEINSAFRKMNNQRNYKIYYSIHFFFKNYFLLFIEKGNKQISKFCKYHSFIILSIFFIFKENSYYILKN